MLYTDQTMVIYNKMPKTSSKMNTIILCVVIVKLSKVMNDYVYRPYDQSSKTALSSKVIFEKYPDFWRDLVPCKFSSHYSSWLAPLGCFSKYHIRIHARRYDTRICPLNDKIPVSNVFRCCEVDLIKQSTTIFKNIQ